MSDGPARGWRVFVALVPPLELCRELVRRTELALGPLARELRLVPPEHVHVTLAFLGELDAARCTALERALARTAAAAGPLALVLGGAGGFPSAAAARVAWAGVRDAPDGVQGALAALRAGLVRELGAEGLDAADGARPFRPHLSLARPRGPHAPALPAAFVELALELGWHAREIAALESRLGRPAAERYRLLARRALAGP